MKHDMKANRPMRPEVPIQFFLVHVPFTTEQYQVDQLKEELISLKEDRHLGIFHKGDLKKKRRIDKKAEENWKPEEQECDCNFIRNMLSSWYSEYLIDSHTESTEQSITSGVLSSPTCKAHLMNVSDGPSTFTRLEQRIFLCIG
jgi:glutamine phosphoribosylpyrophosphate amidotransferase